MVMQHMNKIMKLLMKSILVCLRKLTGRYIFSFFSLKVEETKVLSWFSSAFVSKKAKGVVWRSQGNGGLRGEFKGEDLGWLSQPIFSLKNPYEDCLLVMTFFWFSFLCSFIY